MLTPDEAAAFAEDQIVAEAVQTLCRAYTREDHHAGFMVIAMPGYAQDPQPADIVEAWKHLRNYLGMPTDVE